MRMNLGLFIVEVN